jgi:uncharacterized membrane protein
MFLDVNIDVNGIAKQIADAIGQVNKAAQPVLLHGWDIYVRQQFMSGVVGLTLNLLFAIPLVIVAIIFLPKLYRWARNYDYDDSRNDGLAYLVPAILNVVAVIALVFMIFNIAGAVMHIVNPEYYAFQDILTQLGLNKS